MNSSISETDNDMTVIEYYIGKKNVENIETSEPEMPSTQG
jgi:hypothetical protein